MKAGTAIALTGLGIFALSKLATARVAASLHLILANFKIDLSGITVNILAQNPTSGSFTFYSMAGDVYLNDSIVGNIGSFTATTIAANAETTLPVLIRLSPTAILIQLTSLFNGTTGNPLTMRVTGTANVDDTAIPFDLSCKLLP
jgi:LEA14-like dessication related protein